MLAPDVSLRKPEIDPAKFPLMAWVRQTFSRPRVRDVEGRARAEARAAFGGRLKSGMRVAITAGSRGIASISAILRAAVDEARYAGAQPFLVSAMGSHGGGTVEGQWAVLRDLGITEDAVGAPIRIGTDTVRLGSTPMGFEVHCDVFAAEADAILVVNRVKPHTVFRGRSESGILKMLAIGLGKVPGATAVHRLGAAAMAHAVAEAAHLMMERTPVIGGVAIVENAYGESAVIRGLSPERMEEGDQELLRVARSLMPSLPVREADLLIVEEIGKDISGTGMDVNVTGRWGKAGAGLELEPGIRRIVVLGLSPASHGNANGIGLADFTTRRTADQIDPAATSLNVMTTGYPDRGVLPIVMDDDRAAIGAALESLRLDDPSAARAVRIRNTLQLADPWVSQALLAELPAHASVVEPPAPMRFTEEGRLI